jgi:hypothetical protein
MDFIDGIDLTPAAAPNPFGAAGYSEGGGGVAGFGEEATVVGGFGGIDLGEVAGGGGNDHGRSPSSHRDLGDALSRVDTEERPEEHLLVLIGEPPGRMRCCGLGSSGQGVRRFCLQPITAGSNGCGTGSHRTKAAVAAHHWYVTVGIRGGMRAGLLDKCLGVDEVLDEDKPYFSTEAHSAGEWETWFQTSRMAKLGAGLLLKARSAAGLQATVNVRDYAKTPAKQVRVGEAVDLSPSWVNVESEGMGFGNIKVWDPLSEQEVVNRIALNNFNLLKKETIRAATNWSDAVGQLRESTQQLISA